MSSEDSLILFAPGDNPKDCWGKTLQDDQVEATLLEDAYAFDCLVAGA
jgi:hypothetical protein